MKKNGRRQQISSKIKKKKIINRENKTKGKIVRKNYLLIDSIFFNLFVALVSSLKTNGSGGTTEA